MKKIFCVVSLLVFLGVFATASAASFLAPIFMANYGQYAEMLGVPDISTEIGDNIINDDDTLNMSFDWLSVDSGRNDYLVKNAMLVIRYEGCNESDMNSRAQALFMACTEQNPTTMTMATVARLAKKVEPHMDALKKTLSEKAEALKNEQIVYLYDDDNWVYCLFQADDLVARYVEPLE